MLLSLRLLCSIELIIAHTPAIANNPHLLCVCVCVCVFIASTIKVYTPPEQQHKMWSQLLEYSCTYE